MARKVLNLAIGKGNEIVALKKIEDALTQKIHDDANVAAVVEAVTKVDAAVAVLLVVCLQRGQNTQFDLASIAVFLNRPNDLDGDILVVASPVTGLHNLSERALSKELDHRVYHLVN